MSDKNCREDNGVAEVVIRWNRDAWLASLWFTAAAVGLFAIVYSAILTDSKYWIGLLGVAMFAWFGYGKLRSARIAADAERLGKMEHGDR